MYEIRGEQSQGPFGLFKKVANLGSIPEGVEVALNNGTDHVLLSLDEEALVIKSLGETPVKIEYRAQQQMEKLPVVDFLYPGRTETRTGRSHITITPMGRKGAERIVVQGPEPHPLTLSNEEVNGLMRGVDLMRSNVIAAHHEGHR